MANTQEKQDKDIEEMDYIVQKALEMLIGSGEHRSGIEGITGALFQSSTSLKNALKVGMGVTIDHWHMGYKDVTMQAFQRGLQRLYEDNFVALKILEGNSSHLDEKMRAKLQNKQNRTYILQMLGFKKKDIKEIEELIERNPDNAMEFINDAIKIKAQQQPEKKDELGFRKKQIQKIEFMLNGAQCYLPFAEPNDGFKLNMPLKNVQGEYELQEMQVERINMSQGLSGPYYALNLRSTNQEKYFQDLTIFMGTNPLPVASGPMATLHSDSIPGESVGANFVKGSKDLFENIFQQQFKQNLEKLLQEAADTSKPTDLRDENDHIKYEDIWLKSRVKCVGQSLGGSIPLQMLARFPHLVEIAAFEPPFLTDDYKNIIENNLANAHTDFNNLINEVKLPEGIDSEKLKKVVPSDIPKLKSILKENNVAITQLVDPITLYGHESPPLSIYHVDTNKAQPKYQNITKKVFDKAYKAVMAGSIMSHAMVLGGQNNKIIKKLDDDLKRLPRQGFTAFLHKIVWKVLNPPIAAYFQLKHFYLKYVHNPRMNPSKSPVYLETNKAILARNLQGKWNTIKHGIDNIDTPNAWQQGDHLKQKIEELGRMMKLAEELNLDIENENNQLITDTIKQNVQRLINDDYMYKSSNTRIYADLLRQALYDDDKNVQNRVKDILLEKSENQQGDALPGLIERYTTQLQKEDSHLQNKNELELLRQKIVQNYTLLDDGNRKLVLKVLEEKVKDNQLLVTTPHHGLLKDLQYHAKSPDENKTLGKLIRIQEYQISRIQFDGEIKAAFDADFSKLNPNQLSNLKDRLQEKSSEYFSRELHKELNSLAGRLLIDLTNRIDSQIKINEYSNKDPRNPENSTLSSRNKPVQSLFGKHPRDSSFTSGTSDPVPSQKRPKPS